MLKITVPPIEVFDNDTNTFMTIKEQKLVLEHSLISISKWEANWHKPFLETKQKTKEETIDYVRCMNLNDNVDPIVFYFLPEDVNLRIADYIEDSMSATKISSIPQGDGKSPRRSTITSELIYYYMVAFNIPFECQKWHINRLVNLIKICDVKSTPPKKMSKREIMQRNKSLNDARRAALHSKG